MISKQDGASGGGGVAVVAEHAQREPEQVVSLVAAVLALHPHSRVLRDK